MTPKETSDLLGLIATVDNRLVDDATVYHWAEILADLSYADCRTAVVEHRRTSADYLQPIHVRRLAERLDRDRRRAVREAREAEQQRALEAQPRTDRRAEIAAGIRELLRERGYPGDPSKLHPRRDYWDRKRRAYERMRGAEPNPAYAGPPPEGGHPMPTVDGDAP